MFTIGVLGAIAFILTCLIQAPQAIKVIKTRKVRDISKTTYFLMWFASLSWISYGLLAHDWAVGAANVVVFCLASTILYFKLTLKK
jgi:MtN3 and saliva related transmembrane protein